MSPQDAVERDQPAAMERAPTTLRVAVVGCGRLFQRYYIPALASLKHVRVAAVADPRGEQQAVAMALIPGVVTYPSVERLLHDVDVDAVLVGSTPSTHLSILNAVCRKGVPVFIEKPFVLRGELSGLEGAAARSLVMIDFNRRFWPTYQRIGALVRSGVLGSPTDVEFALRINLLPWCTVTEHRLAPHEGGVLYDLGSLALDLVAVLLGEDPIRISAHARTVRWPSDHIRLELEFANRVRARCELAYETRTTESLMVRAEKGSLWLPDPNRTFWIQHDGSGAGRLASELRGIVLLGVRGIWRGRSMGRYSIREALETFFESIQQGQSFVPGFDAAVKNTLWLEAAGESLNSGSWVRICQSGENGESPGADNHP
jgi:predicted dehydrogenase